MTSRQVECGKTENGPSHQSTAPHARRRTRNTNISPHVVSVRRPLAHCRTRVFPSPYLRNASGNVSVQHPSPYSVFEYFKETAVRFSSMQRSVFLQIPRRWLVTIQRASDVGHANVSKLLPAQEAHPSASASDGFSAMFTVCGKGHRTLVTLLIDHGATVTFEPEARDHFSCLASTTMLTSQRCFWSIGPMLPKSSSGLSPFRAASGNRHADEARLLLLSTVTLRLPGRVMPLRCAAIYDHREIAQLLMEKSIPALRDA